MADYNFAPDGTLDLNSDGRGTVSDYEYDHLRRLTQVLLDVDGSDLETANAITLLGYDSQDHLTDVTDPNNGTTVYDYDDLGNLVAQSSPYTGTTSFGYDPAGNVTTRTDAEGRTFAYAYDARNRITSIITPLPLDDLFYDYDSCFNGINRLCSVSQGNEFTDYSYNVFGDITAHQGVGYSYDASGRIQTVSYPSGDSVTYHYDSSGQIDRVDALINGTPRTLASNISYAPFGPLTSLTYGNGAVLSQTVDTAYRLSAQSIAGVFQRNYTEYDANGNLNTVQDLIANTSDQYGYDALDRMNSASGGFGTQSLDYDLNGNRLSSQTNSGTTNYAYDADSNRMSQINSTPVVLDANGNTLSDCPGSA